MKKKQVTQNTNWEKIKKYFIQHDISLSDLAKKFKVNLRTLQTHSSKEKWVDCKKGLCTEIENRYEEKFISSELERRKQANEDHLKLYDKATQIVDLLLEKYLTELKDGDEKTKANAYSLDAILKAINTIQKGQRLALNIDKEESTENVEPEVRIIEGLNEEKI